MSKNKKPIEKKVKVFHKMQPESPDSFNSSGDEIKYLINVMKEKTKKIEMLQREIDLYNESIPQIKSDLEKREKKIELLIHLLKPGSMN